jgi:predicted secreted protein
MTHDELNEHIAELESKLEQIKAEVLITRACRKTRMDEMSEDEREKYVARVRKQKTPEPKTPKVPTMKSDPIGYLMSKHGMTKAQAEKMMGL